MHKLSHIQGGRSCGIIGHMRPYETGQPGNAQISENAAQVPSTLVAPAADRRYLLCACGQVLHVARGNGEAFTDTAREDGKLWTNPV